MLMPVDANVEPNRRDLVYISQTPTLANTTMATMTSLARLTCNEAWVRGNRNKNILNRSDEKRKETGNQRVVYLVAEELVNAHSDLAERAGRRAAQTRGRSVRHVLQPAAHDVTVGRSVCLLVSRSVRLLVSRSVRLWVGRSVRLWVGRWPVGSPSKDARVVRHRRHGVIAVF